MSGTRPDQAPSTDDAQSAANIKAIALMALSMVLFAIDDAAIKAAGTAGTGILGSGGAATPGEIIFIKGVLGTLCYGALMVRERTALTFTLLHTMARDKALMARTVGDLLSAMAIITALTLMPLSQLSAILQVLPLVVTLGAALVLKEAVGWRRWSAILVGFIGVMIIIRPGAQSLDIGTVWALVTVLGLCVRDLATRRIKVQFSTFSIVTIVAFLLIPMGTGMHMVMDGGAMFDNIAPAAWALILGGGVFGMGAYYSITVSMRIGEISAVAPYRYTRLVAALILAYIFFGEVPDFAMIIGATLVIGAGLFTLYREQQLKRAAKRGSI